MQNCCVTAIGMRPGICKLYGIYLCQESLLFASDQLIFYSFARGKYHRQRVTFRLKTTKKLKEEVSCACWLALISGIGTLQDVVLFGFWKNSTFQSSCIEKPALSVIDIYFNLIFTNLSELRPLVVMVYHSGGLHKGALSHWGDQGSIPAYYATP